MNKYVLISVIVPVYKTEKYVEKCITSILLQNYKNFELILIDDGSPDNAGKICDLFAAKDKRIRCIHIANGGVSNARNTGIKYANGKFIVFIDSDDWVSEDHLENLLSVASSGGLGTCGFFTDKRNDMNEIIKLSREKGAVSVYSSSGIGGFPFNKIFDKNIIDQNRLKFSSRYTMCEDLLFCIQYIHFMTEQYIQCSQKQTYHYELTMGAVKGRFKKNHIFSEKDFSEYLAVKESGKYISQPEVKVAWNVRLVKAAVNSLRAVVAGHHTRCKEYRKLLTYIRHNLLKMIVNSNVAMSSKLSTCLSAISPKLEYYIYLKKERKG
jgi:glycosyltransferase involved in cell wall biosynthesis